MENKGKEKQINTRDDFRIPRYAVSIEVYDNNTKGTLVSEVFSCDDKSVIRGAFDKAFESL